MIINKERLEGCKEELKTAINTLATSMNFPIVINSGLRSGDPLAHGQGEAADIDCRRSDERFRIIKWALEYGIKRIGVYNLHIHIDFSKTAPQPVLWWDVSR